MGDRVFVVGAALLAGRRRLPPKVSAPSADVGREILIPASVYFIDHATV